MADKWAVSSGNWSNPATWNGGTVPVDDDDVYANGKTVTLDVSTPVVNLLSSAANPPLGVISGGGFDVTTGITVSANTVVAGAGYCVYVSNSVSWTAAIGTCRGSDTGGYPGIYHSSSGTLNGVVTSAIGGAYNGSGASGIWVTGGTVNIVCDGFGSPTAENAHGIFINGGSGHTILGTMTGGASGSVGLWNATGNIVNCAVAKGNDFPNGGATVGAPGTFQANNAGAIRIQALIFGSGGWHPVQGRHFIDDAATNYCQMRQSNNGAVTVIGESNDYPMPNNVRSGVSYNFGASVGTCAVPPAGSVALGVPVDATVGTAALSPTALLGADLKARLENCATVQTTGDQLAALM